MRAIAGFTLQIGTALLAILAFAVPATAAIWEVAAHSDWATAALDARKLELLVRGLRISLLAAVLSQVVGALLAAGLASPPRSWLRRLTIWICGVAVLTPPYVAAYGWSLPILPEGIANSKALAEQWWGWLATEGRAIACLGLWTAPIAGVVLAGGWRATGLPALRLALTDARAPRAFVQAAAPAMGIWLGLSITACLVLTITEYSVCSLCLVQVWNTEILALTQNLTRSGQAFLLAWPVLALVLLLMTAWLPMRRRLTSLATDLAELPSAAAETSQRPLGRGLARNILVLATLVLLLVPWMLIVRGVGNPKAFVSTWAVFRQAWQDGVVIGLGGMLISLWLAIGVDYMRLAGGRRRWLALSIAVLAGLFAFAPPVLVGDAFAAAYAPVPWITDTVAIVSLTAAARYAFIAVVVIALASRLTDRDVLRAALVDRADAWTVYRHIRLPAIARPALGVAGVLAVLCMTEVSASQMITPPGVDNLALTLLNMIHYGRNDEVGATMVYLLVAIALVVGIADMLISKGRRRATTRD